MHARGDRTEQRESSRPVPNASKLGAAKIVTPLLEAPLEGSIYLAQPYENEPAFGSPEHPGGSLLALYLVAEGDGMLIKLAGKVEADPSTGQLTVTFARHPAAAVRRIEAEPLRRAAGAARDPAGCGAYE